MRTFVILIGALTFGLFAACGGSDDANGLQTPRFNLPGTIVSFGEASLASGTVQTADNQRTWIHVLSQPVNAQKDGEILVVASGRAEVQGQDPYAFAVGIGVNGGIAATQEYLGLFRGDSSIPIGLSKTIPVKEGDRTIDLWVWNEVGDPVIVEATIAGLVFEEKDGG